MRTARAEGQSNVHNILHTPCAVPPEHIRTGQKGARADEAHVGQCINRGRTVAGPGRREIYGMPVSATVAEPACMLAFLMIGD